MNKTYFKTQNIALAKQALCGKKETEKKKKYDIKDVDKDKLLIVGKSEKIKKELHDRHRLLQNEVIDHIEITEKLNKLDSETAAERIYKLSVTDLFVEKAIHLLDVQANQYKKVGTWAFTVATFIIVIGVIIASIQSNVIPIDIVQSYNNNNMPVVDSSLITKDNLKDYMDSQESFAVINAFMSFAKSFTFYGLLVLSAVFLKRYGKASLDQAERIHDRRHALRQGRLYIHLKDGNIKTVDELEKAFNWNSSQNNAFADINTEAQAPWGNALKEVVNIIPKVIESSKK